MRGVVVAALLVGGGGCGRVGFDPIGDGGGSGSADGGPGGPWGLIQVRGAVSSSVMLGSTGAGHLIVVAVQTDAASTVASVTDDAAGGSNGYVAVPGSRATNGAPSEGIELWYAEGARAGATTVTATGGTGMSIVAWEFSGIATTNALDVGAALDNGVSSMTPVGPMLTTRQAGEVVVSAIVLPGQIGSIRLGNEFTNDLVTNDNGWAHLTSTAAPAGAHQAQWSANTAGAYCAAAAAFVTGP